MVHVVLLFLSVAGSISSKIYSTVCKVTTYDGELLGETFCPIQFSDEMFSHTFLIAKGDIKVNIFGRDLLQKFNFKIVHKSSQANTVSTSVLSEFADYLSDDFVSNVREAVKLDIPSAAKPIYLKARQTPLRLKAELTRLVSSGKLLLTLALGLLLLFVL